MPGKDKTDLARWKEPAMAVASSEFPKANVPFHVFLGEAVDVYKFFEKNWLPELDGKREVRRGLVSAAGKKSRIHAKMGAEILSLQRATQEAQTQYLLTVDPRSDASPVTRGRFLLDELMAVLEYFFDDGVEDDDGWPSARMTLQMAVCGDDAAGIDDCGDDAASMDDCRGVPAPVDDRGRQPPIPPPARGAPTPLALSHTVDHVLSPWGSLRAEGASGAPLIASRSHRVVGSNAGSARGPPTPRPRKRERRALLKLAPRVRVHVRVRSSRSRSLQALHERPGECERGYRGQEPPIVTRRSHSTKALPSAGTPRKRAPEARDVRAL